VHVYCLFLFYPFLLFLRNTKRIFTTPLFCKKELKQQLNNLRGIYKRCRILRSDQSKRLSERIRTLQQSLNENLKCSFCKINWSDINPSFIRTFNLDRSSLDLNGIKFQHVLQKEFHDIAQKTAQAWILHGNNTYIQQLIEKNITCIKNGIELNQSGKLAEATRFADIGWAVLDHIQALGEGICQGAGNTVQAFLHPIDTIQGTARGIVQCTYYLGQATLEAIDLSILAVTDHNAARKKLQIWKQNFTQLVDTFSEQWQVMPSHNITRLVSSFATELFLTGKAFRSLDGLLSFARINSAKLIRKTQRVTEPVHRATTAEGMTTSINKAVKHTQRTSRTGHTVKRVTTKLKKTRKPIQELFEQKLQSRQLAKTGHITEQSAAKLRKKRPKATKEFAQQRQSYQPEKTGSITNQNSFTELTKPKTIKKFAKKDKFTQPIKSYVGSLNVNLKSNIIQEFNNIKNMEKHIFSDNHVAHGIFNLGKNENDIVDEFVNIVKLADHKNLLKHGPNQIHTIINNHKVVIRAFIEEGKVLRVNGFIEDNVNKIGNVFELLVKEYQYGQKIIN